MAETRRRRLSLRMWLLIPIIVVVPLLRVALYAVEEAVARNQASGQITARGERVLGSVVLQLQERLRVEEILLRELSEQPGVVRAVEQNDRTALAAAVVPAMARLGLGHLTVYGLDAQELLNLNAPAGGADATAMVDAALTGLSRSAPSVGAGGLTVTAAVPIKGASGIVGAMVVGSGLTGQRLQEIGNRAAVQLAVFRAGVLVDSTVVEPELLGVLRAMAPSLQLPGPQRSQADAALATLHVRPVVRTLAPGALLVVLVPTIDLDQAAEQRSGLALLGLVLLTGTLVVIGILAARMIAMPLERMVVATDRIVTGDYTTRFGPTPILELDRMGQAISQLAQQVKHQIGALAAEVAERRSAEVAAEKARDEALDASRVKSEFLANMSHEIRTPMNAIMGMADLLADTPLDSEQQEYVGIFRRAGDTLLSLIDDILDLSKVEAGQLTLEVTAFDLAVLMEDTAEVLAARAQAKGLELTCEVSPDVPTRVLGDPQRLRQVLLNLLGNAVKFTAQGEVNLRLECTAPVPESPGLPSASPARALRFTVRDTGIGIASDQLAAVFGAFTQGDASTTRRYGGTGLGLTIVERLVGLMGGKIEVESTLGRGTTFAFTVPLTPVTDDLTLAPTTLMSELAGTRVLVVDDNTTNRLILTRLLTPFGVVVTAADGGQAGLDALRAARVSGTPYDLVLLDQQMPDLDGFQLVARLQSEAPGGAVGDAGGVVARAILMLSSDQRVGDVARANALGITRYLIKPVKRAALLATIVTTLRDYAVRPGEHPGEHPAPTAPITESPPLPGAAIPGTSGASGSSGPAPTGLRLLLVDDSADNRRLVQLYLGRLPYVLVMAADGQAGFEAFTAGAFDLVLMDVHMPVMDGLTATRAIRAWERAQGRPPTPVVALSASAMPQDVRRTLDAGCDAHLAKPVKKTNLLAAIVKYTEQGVSLAVAEVVVRPAA